jgi:hypothetical protein
MKVYFTASITYRNKYINEYSSIIKVIKELGHEYLEAYDVLNRKLSQVLKTDADLQQSYYKKWQRTIAKADIAIVEASFPSTVHIGFEIAHLLERGKPTIILYTKGNNPTLASEYHSQRAIKLEYSVDTLKDDLKWGLEEAEQMLNRRFTFFISPNIDAFLNKIMKQKGLSKSEYIRELIEKNMK